MVAGVGEGAELGRTEPLFLRVNQTTAPAASPATAPAIPIGIHGIADSVSKRVDARAGVLASERLVDDRSRATSRLTDMSRVTVTVTGPADVGMDVGVSLCVVTLAILSFRSSRLAFLS